MGHTSGRLLTWEMTVCSSTVILNKTEVLLPKKALVKDIAWCPDSDNVLAIADRNGHIYLSNSTGSEVQRIVLTQRCAECTEIEPAAVCWYRGGLVLRTTFCQIRYYRKDDNNFWRKVWHKKNTGYPSALTSHPSKNNRVFLATRQGHVMKINFSEDELDAEIDVKHFVGGKYLQVDFIHPWEDHIVAIDPSMELSVVQVSGGAEIAKVNLEISGKITSMLSHPDYPLVIVSSDKGEVAFVSFIDQYYPSILGKWRMQSEALDLMKFSSSGRFVQNW